MAKINPTTLQQRIQTAINNTPRLVKESLEESNLERINRENLLQGKDSDGGNMPRYRDPDYANFKVTINSRNRGFWDLKLSDEYHRGIEARITPTVVFFRQKFSNPKIDWLHERLDFFGANMALGISKEQMIEVQENNKPKIAKALKRIINGV